MDKITLDPARLARSLTPKTTQVVHAPDRTATLNEKKNGKHKTARQDWRHIARHTDVDNDAWDTLPSFERMR